MRLWKSREEKYASQEVQNFMKYEYSENQKLQNIFQNQVQKMSQEKEKYTKIIENIENIQDLKEFDNFLYNLIAVKTSYA
jgi:predicted PurR-regulated permease PerM